MITLLAPVEIECDGNYCFCCRFLKIYLDSTARCILFDMKLAQLESESIRTIGCIQAEKMGKMMQKSIDEIRAEESEKIGSTDMSLKKLRVEYDFDQLLGRQSGGLDF